MNSRLSIADTSAGISESQYEVLARNAALAGFERAKNGLASSYTSNNFTGTVEGVEYNTSVTVVGDVAKIVSSGSFMGARTGSAKNYHIRSEYSKSGGTTVTSPLPEYMEYALLAEGDLRLSGNAGASYVYSTDAGNGSINANMHTNGDLSVNGIGNERMQGFGTYAGSASGKHIDAKFQPRNDPDGLGNTHQSGSVSIPTVDVGAIVAEWSPDYTISSGSISGAQVYAGTRTAPAIVHVPGNLTISGTISGYVVFLVEGDITIAGNTQVGTTGYSGTDESSIAFYGEGGFDMTGGSDVWGQVLVNGDFETGGNARLFGSVTTGSTAWMHGTPDIMYREASNALTQVLAPAPVAGTPQMVAYAEF